MSRIGSGAGRAGGLIKSKVDEDLRRMPQFSQLMIDSKAKEGGVGIGGLSSIPEITVSKLSNSDGFAVSAMTKLTWTMEAMGLSWQELIAEARFATARGQDKKLEFVIDTLKAKEQSFNPNYGLESLIHNCKSIEL